MVNDCENDSEIAKTVWFIWITAFVLHPLSCNVCKFTVNSFLVYSDFNFASPVKQFVRLSDALILSRTGKILLRFRYHSINCFPFPIRLHDTTLLKVVIYEPGKYWCNSRYMNSHGASEKTAELISQNVEFQFPIH